MEIKGERFMTGEDFIRKYIGLFPDENYNRESVKLLAGIVNASKDGLISYAEFQAFEGLLCFPDALYKTAFQLFDTNGNGVVTFGKFKTTLFFYKKQSLSCWFLGLIFVSRIFMIIIFLEISYLVIPIILEQLF